MMGRSFSKENDLLPMTNIIFICTGNIFRSLTAEFSLRRYLGPNSDVHISSAGTADLPDLSVRDDVSEYLLSKGLNVRQHQRRTLTDKMIAQANIVIPMNNDHQVYLNKKYTSYFPLFTERSGQNPKALPDVDDLFAPEDYYSSEAQNHIYRTIDTIIKLTPDLAKNLDL